MIRLSPLSAYVAGLFASVANAQGFDFTFFSGDELTRMGIVMHGGSPVAAYCAADATRRATPEICLREQVAEAIAALSAVERWAFFERISSERPADGPPTVDERLSGSPGARRPCTAVTDAGHLNDESFWLIRCDDDRRLVLQFTGERVASGLECHFVAQYMGANCDDVTWVLGAAHRP
jgi:hypothetical protein